MKPLQIAKVLPVAVALAGVIVLAAWLASEPKHAFSLRVPGMDGTAGKDVPDESTGSTVKKAASSPSNDDGTSLTTFFAKGSGAAGEATGAWPCFRGPAGDGVSHETVPLARSWPSSGPPVLWSVTCGEGYAGPAVLNGRVYLMDYDQEKQADALRCLSLADGKEIWRRWYYVEIPKQHGISRTVPAVNDKYVVAIGPMCQVLCTDAVTGEYIWGMDMVKRYGTTVPPWYAGQCPIIDGNRAILAPCGRKMLVAVNLATGKVEWESPNPRAWKMTHTSIATMQFKGKKMYVYVGSGGAAGISAEDGSILWEYNDWAVPMANVPTPVVCEDGKIFLSGGYRAGSLMLQLEESGGKFTANKLGRYGQDIFGSEQQTPIFYNGHIYGVLTKDSASAKEQLVCLDTQGNQLWKSGRENRFGPYGGPYLIAQDMIMLVNDDGVMSVVQASPQGYTQLGRWTIFKGKEFWAPMALAGGKLLIRDLTKMICLDMSKTLEIPKSP